MTENPLSSTSEEAEPCLQQVAQGYQDKRQYSNSTALSFQLTLIFLSFPLQYRLLSTREFSLTRYTPPSTQIV